MVKIRAAKIDNIADYIPLQKIDQGNESGKIVILGWGSTYGSIKTAVAECIRQGISVSHVHLNYIHPFPKNLGQILKKFEKVIVPELNNGQLVKLIRDKFLIDAKGFNKIKGLPFYVSELVDRIKEENQ
jgi:2-oxoglutarate ferredoxin oxidoreductase subunit alpha